MRVPLKVDELKMICCRPVRQLDFSPIGPEEPAPKDLLVNRSDSGCL